MAIALSWLMTIVACIALAAGASEAGDPIPLPGISLVSRGCNPCHAGDRVQVDLLLVRPAAWGDQLMRWDSLRAPDGTLIRLLFAGLPARTRRG